MRVEDYAPGRRYCRGARRQRLRRQYIAPELADDVHEHGFGFGIDMCHEIGTADRTVELART